MAKKSKKMEKKKKKVTEDSKENYNGKRKNRDEE